MVRISANITEKNITEEGLKHSSTNLLQPDDIIISARGTVGAMAMIPFPMAFNQSCYGLRAKTDIVDTIFLYYLLKYKITDIKNNTHGSVFDTITRDTFSTLVVDLPNKDVQQKIAFILRDLDDKIEQNCKINNNFVSHSSKIQRTTKQYTHTPPSANNLWLRCPGWKHQFHHT